MPNNIKPNIKSDVVKFIVSIVICNGAGFVGSFFTRQSINTWYVLLVKPDFTPPGWLFAPAWLILYNLMGIAIFLVWRRGISNHNVKQAIIIFTIQLILNVFWSIAFFGLKSPLYGLIVIVPLWAAIFISIAYFYRISKVSAFLLIPYIVWVSFATILNFNFYILNP